MSRKPTCWSLDVNAPLDDVFEWCIQNHSVDRILLALRMQQVHGRWGPLVPGLDTKAKQLFGAHLVDSFLASAWPATKLIQHPAQIMIIAFNAETKRTVLENGSTLSAWLHNAQSPLPEDLCLFSEKSAMPVLVSCTHERDAWLITDKAMTLRGTAKARLKTAELTIPQTKYFCKRW